MIQLILSLLMLILSFFPYEGDALDQQADFYEGVLNGVTAPAAPIVITHTNDPCQEDEVLWWVAPHTRGCVSFDNFCEGE